ncbi:hypothetical protein PHLCEN_2v99, partial [Hermanssonia centrifuga]
VLFLLLGAIGINAGCPPCTLQMLGGWPRMALRGRADAEVAIIPADYPGERRYQGSILRVSQTLDAG